MQVLSVLGTAKKGLDSNFTRRNRLVLSAECFSPPWSVIVAAVVCRAGVLGGQSEALWESPEEGAIDARFTATQDEQL